MIATLKVIGQEDKGQNAVDDAAKTVRGIQSIYTKEFEVVVGKGTQ